MNTDPVEYYKELERLYTEAAKSKSYCSHKDSKTTQDENGVYHFHCPACGLTGMGNFKSALTLGWLLYEH